MYSNIYDNVGEINESKTKVEYKITSSTEYNLYLLVSFLLQSTRIRTQRGKYKLISDQDNQSTEAITGYQQNTK